uniref:EF-hand domain-containing protein n=1 Tax=Eptatretus burgeri TaxID=7764 RepID=A0A8C4PWE6_EPTBU
MVEAQEMQPIDGVMSGVQLVTDCPRCQARWRLKVAVAVLYALCFILLFSLVVLGCVAWKQLEEASSEMQELFVEHGDINGTGEVTKGEWQREMDTLAEVRALLDEVRSEMDESNRDLIWQRSQLTQLHGQQLALKGSLSDMHADILQLKDKLEMFAKRLQSITDTHKDISAAQAMLGGPPWKTTWMENAHLKQDLAWTKTSLVEQANALQVLEFVIEHLEWAQSEAGEIWMKVHDGLLRNVLLLESMHRDALEYNSAVIQGSLLSLDNAKSFDAILSTLNEHSVQVDNVTFTVSIHKDNMEDLMEHMEFVRNRTHDYFDTINGTLDLQNLEV